MQALETLRTSEHLTENECAIARYVLDHPEESTRLSSRELARRTLTSPTAVLRFCKKLGFENYNEFKVNIVSELKSLDLASTMIVRDEPAVNVLNKLAVLEAQVIEETKRKASPELLDAIATRVASSSYVDFFARDANATVARYASHNFVLAGRVSTVYADLDQMIYASWELPDNHLVFLISKSGTDRAICISAEHLRERGVSTVAITANVASPLARSCDQVLEGFYYPQFEKFGDVVFSSAAKYLFDALFVLTFSKDYDSVKRLNRAYDHLYYGQLDRSR